MESGGSLKLQNATAKHFPDLALEKLGAGDFFPGFRPTQEVGSVSGRIIGRQPIFVASGGLFPFGITEARKRALERAAQIKLASQQAVLQGGPDAKPQYRRQLKSIWIDFTNDWGRKTNQNFSGLKGNSEFIEGVTSIFTLAKEIDFLVDTAEGVLDDLNKDRFVPEDIEMLATNIVSGQIPLEEMAKNPQKFIRLSKDLKSYSNLMNIIRTEAMPLLEDSINEVIDTMDPETIQIIRSTNDYDLILKKIKENIDPEVLTDVASFIKQDFDVFQDLDEIENRMLKIFGGRVKQSIQVARKFNLSAQKSLRRKDPKFISEEFNRINITDKVTIDGVETEKTISLQTAGGFNLGGISRAKGINITPDVLHNIVADKIEKVVGVLNVDVVEIINLLVDPTKNNKIVFQAGTGDLSIKTKGLVQKRFAVIKAREDNDVMGIEEGETRLVAFDNVEQPLKNIEIEFEGNRLIIEGEEVGVADFGGMFE